jgi:MFS family permease
MDPEKGILGIPSRSKEHGMEEKEDSDLDSPISPRPEGRDLETGIPSTNLKDQQLSKPSNGNLDLAPDASATEGTNADNITRTKSTLSIAETLSLPREIVFVSTICMAQFMTQVGLGNTLPILAIITDSFHSSPAEAPWYIAGYSLTIGTFILFSGRLGDLYGYKLMLLIGLSWFAFWSLIAGFSVYSEHAHVLFIFARVLQGIGPAIALPNGLAILGATYKPGRRKAMIFSMFGACAPIGGVAGAVFGSLFARAWWPWAYWSFAITLVATAVIGWYAIPDPPRKIILKGRSTRDKIEELDPLGATTGVAALILFNFAWNQAPIVGWDKVYVYVCLILSLVFVAAFFYVELRLSKYPLIPFSALSLDVSFVLACVACGWAGFGIWIYYSFQFHEVLRGASPLLASAWISPVAVSGVLAALAGGYLLGVMRPAWVMVGALTAFTLGNVLMMTAPIDQIYWKNSFICAIVIPWGMDMSFPAATLILSDAVKKEHQGVAASLVNTIVNYSISLGLGFAGTVEVHINNGGKTPGDLLKGYRGAWYVGAGLPAVGILISLIFVVKGVRGDRSKIK